jgi:hypothetical protein
MGEITKAIYEMQLDGRVRSLEDARTFAKEILSADYADYTDKKGHLFLFVGVICVICG